jgi:hypothetical protein
LRQEPAADEGAHNSNDEIADDPKPGALHDLTGQPSSNEASADLPPTYASSCSSECPSGLGQQTSVDKTIRLSNKAEGTFPMPGRYTCAKAETVLNCSRQQIRRSRARHRDSAKNDSYALICGWSCKTTFSNERWTSMPPL